MRKMKMTGLNVFAILFCLLIYACKSSKDSVTPSSKSIKIVSHLELYNPEQQILPIDDSFYVSYVDDYTIISLLHHTSNTTLIKKVSESAVDDNGPSWETTLEHFAYRENDSVGFRFTSTSDLEKKTFSVDSFLKKVAFHNTIFIDKNDRLISTDSGSESIRKIYIPLTKPDLSYSDTTILYYKPGLNGMPFSFAKAFDSTANMKLAKLHLIYNSMLAPESGIGSPRRDWYFEMSPSNIGDSLHLMNLVKSLNK